MRGKERKMRGREEEEKKPSRLTPANVIPSGLAHQLAGVCDEWKSAGKLGGRVRSFLPLLVSVPSPSSSIP